MNVLISVPFLGEVNKYNNSIHSILGQADFSKGGITFNNIFTSFVDPINRIAYFTATGSTLLSIPLNYTGPVSTSAFTVNVTGIGELRSAAVDEVNGYTFMGTDLGIGLMYQTGNWDDFELFYGNKMVMIL